MEYLPIPSAQAYFEETRRNPVVFFSFLATHPLYLVLFLLIPYTLASIIIVPLVISNWNAMQKAKIVGQMVPESTSIFTLPPKEPADSAGSPPPTGGLIPPTPTPIPPSLVPVEIAIPKLNIKTAVEQVGQTKSLNMDVPKNAANTAWYVYGAKPGEAGNAVINGHYDTPSGRPAVFYNLRKLDVGDEVTIFSEDGIETTFVVTGKEIHSYEEFPNEFVFHTKPGTNLNLITCDGIWDQAEKIYDKRLVVYTEKKEDTK